MSVPVPRYSLESTRQDKTDLQLEDVLPACVTSKLDVRQFVYTSAMSRSQLRKPEITDLAKEIADPHLLNSLGLGILHLCAQAEVEAPDQSSRHGYHTSKREQTDCRCGASQSTSTRTVSPSPRQTSSDNPSSR